MIFYNFSGGMESAAMLVVELSRIKETGAIVCFADTGKQFPEMPSSIAQIESVLGIKREGGVSGISGASSYGGV